MDPRSGIPLLMLGFIHSSLSDPPERTETVGEGMSVNIDFNTSEKCVHLSRRADSNHTWSFPCTVCLGKRPLCPEFRDRCIVFPHGLTLHNVSKADEGIYKITPHLNGNGIATNIVHLVVLDCQPPSTQRPPDSPISGTTRPEGTISVVTGPMDYQMLLGIIVGLIVMVVVIVTVVVIVLKKKSGLSQCHRRRQSSEHPASDTGVPQDSSRQPNEHQVDLAMQEQDLLAMQEQDLLVKGRAQEDQVCVCLKE